MSYTDIFDKCKGDGGYFGYFRDKKDRYFTLPVMESVPGTRMMFQGKEHIMWSVNNYLGLAGNEEIKHEAMEALKVWSVSGPMGSRMMSGNTAEHIELESQLAEYTQKEASILFNYGYLGVIGTVASIVDKDDIIIIEAVKGYGHKLTSFIVICGYHCPIRCGKFGIFGVDCYQSRIYIPFSV